MPRTGPGPRIVIVGATGSGKTTLACDLARALNLPHVELDALNWGPNWTPAPVEVFRDWVQKALRSDAWICEGNYRAVHDLVWPRADELVWLDYPFRVVFPRLLRRTWRHRRNREILWAGNRESIRGQFKPSGILVWQARTHWRLRRQIPARLSQPQHTHLHLSHLRSPKQTDDWLAARLVATLPPPSPAGSRFKLHFGGRTRVVGRLVSWSRVTSAGSRIPRGPTPGHRQRTTSARSRSSACAG